jgi:hypothetical protein
LSDPVADLRAAERILRESRDPAGARLAEAIESVRKGWLAFEEAVGLPARSALAAREMTAQRNHRVCEMDLALYARHESAPVRGQNIWAELARYRETLWADGDMLRPVCPADRTIEQKFCFAILKAKDELPRPDTIRKIIPAGTSPSLEMPAEHPKSGQLGDAR